MNKVCRLFLIMVLLSACRYKGNVIAYSEDPDNGLKKKVIAGKIVYDIQYKPAAYIIKQERVDPSIIYDREKQLSGMAWFNISFSVQGFNQSPLRYGINGIEEYTARQDYYLNHAPKDMFLLYGRDTLYVNSYWFENNQNLALYETMIVGFRLPDDIPAPERDMQFSFYDQVFKNGIVKTVIRKEDLEDLPEL